MPQARSSGPLLTIREASRATGLSLQALRRRVERGTLAAVLVDNRRRIALSELVRAGLLHTAPPDEPRPRKRAQQGTPSGYPRADLEVVLGRIEDLANAIARLEGAVEA